MRPLPPSLLLVALLASGGAAGLAEGDVERAAERGAAHLLEPHGLRLAVPRGDGPLDGLGAPPPRTPEGHLREQSAGATPGDLPGDGLGGWLAALAALAGSAAALGAGWRHLHRRNALDHPARDAILGLVQARPGIHLRAVARATGQPVQQADYHLRVLERLGLVVGRDLGGRRCYHVAGASRAVRQALEEAARAPSPQALDVLRFVEGHPGASQSEVARQLGMLPGSARWHLRRLAERGALEESSRGRARTYRALRPGAPPRSGPRP